MNTRPKTSSGRKSELRREAGQSSRFIEKARELGVDEFSDPLDKVLKRIVKPKPGKKESPDK